VEGDEERGVSLCVIEMGQREVMIGEGCIEVTSVTHVLGL